MVMQYVSRTASFSQSSERVSHRRRVSTRLSKWDRNSSRAEDHKSSSPLRHAVVLCVEYSNCESVSQAFEPTHHERQTTVVFQTWNVLHHQRLREQHLRETRELCDKAVAGVRDARPTTMRAERRKPLARRASRQQLQVPWREPQPVKHLLWREATDIASPQHGIWMVERISLRRQLRDIDRSDHSKARVTQSLRESSRSAKQIDRAKLFDRRLAVVLLACAGHGAILDPLPPGTPTASWPTARRPPTTTAGVCG